jgi:hypothetical protein
MRPFSVFARLLLALGALSASRVLAVPATYVDEDYSPATPGWGVTRFATIADGISAVDTNGTVQVAAGNYWENVVIGKRLTLLGPNAGMAGWIGRSVEAQVNGGTGIAVDVQCSGVIVDGMAMTGATGIRNLGSVGVAIRNNAVTTDAVGIDVEAIATSASSNVTVSGNCLAMNSQLAGGIMPTAGIVLMGVSGAQAPVISNNTVSAAFYGYLLYAVNAAMPTVIYGGDITLAMQGVAVFNVDPRTGTNCLPSFFVVDNVGMYAFNGDYPALPDHNFHAGVHVFTGGGEPAAVVSGLVYRVTIGGTGKIAPGCAGLSFSDFSTNSGIRQVMLVDRCLVEDNLNRGMIVRGRNADTTVARSALNMNGSDPHGAGGNNGFGVSAFNGARLYLTQSCVTNPPTVAGGYSVTALGMFATGGDAGPTVTVYRCGFDNNGATNGSLAVVSEGALYATSNWWGDISGPTHPDNPYGTAGAITGDADYIPWLASGADTSPSAGFQPGPGIAWPPARLAFTSQPAGALPDVALPRAPVVSVLDSNGTLTAWAEPDVTLALDTNPGGATLGGVNPSGATGGMAAFSNIAVVGGIVSSGYTFAASAPHLAGATSEVFEIWQGVAGAISAPETWASETVYAMTGHVFVTSGAELTIEEGTVVRGQAGNSIVVARGSTIRVMGTPTNPVVFTDTGDDHYVGVNPRAGSPPYSARTNGMGGLWGGLAILGNGVISGEGESALPGLEGFGADGRYGGTNDNESSGELHYLSVRYAGGPMGGSEGHGVTLAGVGRGTEVDHVEVFQSAGDGFALLGGAVNASELAAWNCAADSFECGEGYRGEGQFWLGLQGTLASAGAAGDKGIEVNGGYSNGLPTAVPTIFNATLVGTGARWTTASNNSALHFSDTAGGRIRNSLFLDFGGAAALIQGAPGGAADSADACLFNYTNLTALAPDLYPTQDGGKVLEIKNCVFWKMGPNDSGLSAPTNAVPWGGEAGIYHAYGLFSNTTLWNYGWYGSPGSGEIYPAPILRLSRAAVPTVIGGSNFFPVIGMNPLPNTDFYGSRLRTSGTPSPDDGFFRPVWFRGAFDETHNWAAPWTLAYRLGLLTNGVPGDISGTFVDIKAQGLDSGVSIATSDRLTVTLNVTAGAASGLTADWWCVAWQEEAGIWWICRSSGSSPVWEPWTSGAGYRAPLANVTGLAVLDAALLPEGRYVFYFGVDLLSNGYVDYGSLLYDSVDVTVTP